MEQQRDQRVGSGQPIEVTSRPEENEREVSVPEAPARRDWRETFRAAFQHAREGGSRPARNERHALSQDKTKTFFLLAAGLVVTILVFIGMFSSPTGAKRQQENRRTQPSLGRPATGANPAEGQKAGSVTPLLSADMQGQGPETDRLSPEDISNTSRQGIRTPGASPRAPQPKGGDQYALNRIEFDPTVERRQGHQQNLQTPSPPPAQAQPLGPQTREGEGLSKPSLVYVRAASARGATPPASRAPQPGLLEQDTAWTRLPRGTRLVARLQAAINSAVKAPVVAVVEYNYERDGQIVVPAGAKVFGELQQANNTGYVGVRFHSLEMPDGANEKIEATALDLNLGPLKGTVSGNTGKKFLARTLTGVGTVAAYVVAPRRNSGGLYGITPDLLLRERLANNVALAGEQELLSLAYSQNIVVTVPGNTRFYIVLVKGAMEGDSRGVPASRAASLARASLDQRAVIPTVNELRELMELRRELQRMYQESSLRTEAKEERQP